MDVAIAILLLTLTTPQLPIFMALPLVSVVIPTYGRGVFLQRALRSVLDQTYSNIEIIVVDDNGLGSEEQLQVEGIINSFGESIRYLINENNRGGGYTRNQGVAAAQGQYIGFLDDDDEWLPEFSRMAMDALSESGADISYCDAISVVNDLPASARVEINDKHAGNVWEPLISGWCPSSTSLFLIRRAVLEDIPPFDPALASFQDYDCWLSLSKAGCTFTCHDKPMVRKHKHSDGQITTNTVRRREAIGVLGGKWLPRLKPQEQVIFGKTLSRLEKNTYRTDFSLGWRDRHWLQAVQHAIRYLKTRPCSPTDVYRLLRAVV